MIKQLTLLKVVILTFIACTTIVGTTAQQSAIRSTSTSASYSYASLPPGYNYDSIPRHWKVMLTKVEPAKGIPHFKDVYVSDIKAVGVKKVISAFGLKESQLQNFHFNNVQVQGNTAGVIDYGSHWVFDNVSLQGADGEKLKVNNSEQMVLSEVEGAK